MTQQLLGVDTGGTFTDFVWFDGKHLRIHKVLSTPQAPEQAILQGIDELHLHAAIAAQELVIIHGSTVATNAALEGKGVRTVFVTNSGFKDMLTIGRQTRPQLYHLQPELVEPPVPSELCLEVDCRLEASGERLRPLSAASLAQLQADIERLQPEAVAINLLYSFLSDADEKRIEVALRESFSESLFVTRSSFVLPEYKEYERGIATWLNAYLGPLVQRYLKRLQQSVAPAPLGVMQSSGGTIDAEQASQRAVNLLLSGPAGGLAAAQFMGQQCGTEQLLTFDMGGTSTDVALIDGGLRLTNEGRIGPYPVAVPMVDMHTIGAGGGSIASIDAGGLLQVGPQSAGARPGPACYGLGGKQPTVTDANAVLGRLRPKHFLGGQMSLDVAAAQRAVNTIAEPLGLTLEAAAQGIIDLANEHMVRALRVMSVQRGYDPKTFELCCFGGAGGLHVCALADTLGMTRAMVPVHGGVLSALGMLVAPRERQLSKSHVGSFSDVSHNDLHQWLQELGIAGAQQLQAEGAAIESIEYDYSVDVRYQGQSYTLNVPFVSIEQATEAYHSAHEQRYGHRLSMAVELVNVRVRAYVGNGDSLTLQALLEGEASPCEYAELPDLELIPVYRREVLPAQFEQHGPLLICEQVSTTLVAKGWKITVDKVGTLRLQRQTY